jgi:hypothetical protein
MQAFNIKRGRKIIDTVFYNNYPIESAADVEKALKSRGEMPDDCYVTKVRRKMKDEFVMQANYGYGHGWEDECTEETRAEANARLKEYRENAGNVGTYRVIVRRVPV